MRYRTWTLPIILISFLSYNYSQNINLNYKNCNGCPQGANTNTPINNALFVYGNPTSFVIDDLESDFDLRRAGGNTRWHKGLDLRNHGQGADQQRGDAILSPEIGTILDIDHTGYKYVIVDGANYDFGYGHIFSHNNINNTSIWRSGNFVLKMTELDQNNQRFPVIINLDNCTAFCREINKTVTLSNIHCEDTLTTTNHINLDSVFCPIGGSRGSLTADAPVHLHLYKFRNPANGISLSNCSDPLIHIQHPYTAYDLKIALNSDIEPITFSNWNNNNIKYPGNDENTFSLRTTMDNAQQGIDSSRYSNVAHNLDEIQIMIKNKFQSEFKLVEGPHYRSEFSLHAQLNTPLYPNNLHDHYGDQYTTGASPSAYRDNVGFRPFDNYYYANFITRIHKNDPMDGAATPPVVTQDGKWMAVRYGEEYADYSLPTGLIFFNLETKQAVYQDTITPNKGWWIGYFPIHDYIVSVNDYGSSFNNMYSIYKLNQGKKYTRLFDETTGSPGVVILENYDESGVSYPALRHSNTDNAEKKRADFERDFDSANLRPHK